MSPASAGTSLITLPPYECPTRTTGPSTVRTTSATYCASVATDRSGFATAMTTCPAACSGVMIAFQLDDSAKAPCTRTMVGYMVGSFCLGACRWQRHVTVPPGFPDPLVRKTNERDLVLLCR